MDVRLQHRQQKKKVPYGIRFFQWLGKDRNRLYRGHTLLLTFLAYTTYHLSRKPISIVKGSLNGNCSQHDIKASLSHLYSKTHMNMTSMQTSCPSWPPFDSSDSKELLGALDLGFLFAYAVGMFVSGYLAEHMDLRIFLTGGMIISGIFTMLFGLGYFWNIHSLAYFLTMQIFAGFFQSSGWPSVVECVGNWFGKGRRGLIMGIWNSHTSVGNIAGSAIAGIWAGDQWGYSFIVPGLIIIGMGIIVFLFLVVDPLHVGCSPPNHHIDKNSRVVAYVPSEENPEEAGLLSNQDCCPEGSYADSGSVSYSAAVMKKGSEHGADSQAISFWKAMLIPGVVEYSLCLFFAKLVSYTFLFWLPFYLEHTSIGGVKYGAQTSADLSIFFDVGGIAGGIIAGVISDKTNCSGITVVVMLLLGGPMLFIYRFFANSSIGANIGLMSLAGVLVNGPYALITTAVSANLGTHECLQGDTKAMAIVTAIIDGTGSFGAALGPLLTGIISSTGWNNVYYMLIAADLGAAIFLSRQVWFELKTILPCLQPRRRNRSSRISVAESVFHGSAGQSNGRVGQ